MVALEKNSGSALEVIRPIKAGDFKKVSSQHAAVLRLTRDPRFLGWLNEVFPSTFCFAKTPLSGSAILVVALNCPGGLISIGFPADLFPALVLALETDATETPPISTLVASRLFEPLIDYFGKAADEEGDPNWQAIGISAVRLINFDAIRPPLVPLVTYSITLPQKLHTKVGLLSIDSACALALQDIVNVRPVQQHAFTNAWRIVTMLRLSTCYWTAALIESLEVGDVMICQENSSIDLIEAELFCGALIGVHKKVAVKISKKKVTLMSQIMEQDGRNEPREESSAPPLSSSIAELEVPVHFEIDSTALTLAQLASLKPGYVIELAIPVQLAQIRLVACGQIIGRGKLVVVGDCLGVQLETLSGENS